MEIDIGKKVAEYRTKKGITVNRLANMAGISQSYLRDIELGNKQPTVEYLSYICDALDITLGDFFEEKMQKDELGELLDKLNRKQKTALVEFLKALD